jgi:hypothetical protein
MASAPTPGRVLDAGPDERTMSFVLDGTKHVLYPALVTAKDEAAIRAQAGMSFRRLQELAVEDPGVDIIAALAWIARCQAGEKVTLSEVSEGITYGTDLDAVEETEAPVGDDHPLP